VSEKSATLKPRFDTSSSEGQSEVSSSNPPEEGNRTSYRNKVKGWTESRRVHFLKQHKQQRYSYPCCRRSRFESLTWGTETNFSCFFIRPSVKNSRRTPLSRPRHFPLTHFLIHNNLVCSYSKINAHAAPLCEERKPWPRC
jgi:hypothetical protein